MNFKPFPKKTSQLEYHRPKKSRIRLDEAPIPPLSQESKRCLRTLAAYRAPKQKMKYPKSRSAAVLVALFVGRQGDLYVLLSRRSSTLRTYAGDTSLPGGKVDPDDRDVEDTAVNWASHDRNKVPLLCVLEPFLAAELIVTPVVVLILDNTLRPVLNHDEVAIPYHTSFDSKGGPPAQAFRMHRFLTGREAGGIKPVFGLTSAMLIRTATIGYAQRMAWALLYRKIFREACEKEGIDLRTARRIVDAFEKKEAHRQRKDREQEKKRLKASYERP
ncbi:hypothetical protein CPB84DRAFT_1816637 [Gymnopilus junonius]|uniref:Nudix hydrolase domain-containing protein n=1 Tax=Gymnopilus junonius TaxID=109634 RepID=A0A9P5NII3_GYMJU|nr:hypothetical protein CPB84DRAFT_1816637 [Gymnopilus junonius]